MNVGSTTLGVEVVTWICVNAYNRGAGYKTIMMYSTGAAVNCVTVFYECVVGRAVEGGARMETRSPSSRPFAPAQLV